MRRILFALILSFVAIHSEAQAQSGIALQQIATGFNSPLGIVNAHDKSNRLFIVQQGGVISIIKNGSVLATPFLDISSRVLTDGERGLLGLAFHPDYASNGKFYLDFVGQGGNIRIAEVKVSSDPNVANITSLRILLQIPHQQFDNHNGGQIAFGSDGYLYIGVGDGGSEGDPYGNGQNLDTLLGKILRIDVDHKSKGKQYAVPSTNPFINKKNAKPEIWTYGMRNPWRFSFDSATGKLYCGDVGQDRYEEVDLIQRGKNYGWNIMEGFVCYDPMTGCDKKGLTLPLVVYSHSIGDAIMGGYVYRGSAMPAFVGQYFFGDYGSGKIFSMTHTGKSYQYSQLLDGGFSLTSFGVNEAGELFVSDYGNGIVYQIVPQ